MKLNAHHVRSVESLDEIYLVEYKVLSLVFQVCAETSTALHEVLKNNDFPFVCLGDY